MALSKKRQAFVNEYIKCWNASEAARNAGYSPKSAHVTGHRLLKDDKVSAAIEEALEQNTMSMEEVLTRLTGIGRSDKEATQNRINALKLIGMRYAMFVDRTENSGDVTVKVIHERDNSTDKAT